LDNDKRIFQVVGSSKELPRKKRNLMNHSRKEGSGDKIKKSSKPLNSRNRGVVMRNIADDYANYQNRSLLTRLLEGKNATLVVLLIVVLGGGYLINENNKALLDLSLSIKSLVEKERSFHDYLPKSHDKDSRNK